VATAANRSRGAFMFVCKDEAMRFVGRTAMSHSIRPM
jgi:hypothetical protein